MDDYIKRSNAVNAIDEALKRVFVTPIGTDIMRNVPAADVAPVRHGRWIDRPSKRGYGMSTYCSCCGQHSGIGGIESNRHRAYCPNCGARMDGDGE